MWLEHNGHLRLYPPAPVCKPVLQKINSRIVLQNYQKPPVIQIKTRKNIFFLKKIEKDLVVSKLSSTFALANKPRKVLRCKPEFEGTVPSSIG